MKQQAIITSYSLFARLNIRDTADATPHRRRRLRRPCEHAGQVAQDSLRGLLSHHTLTLRPCTPFRRKIVLWFFVTVIFQNYWLSAPYGRNWRFLWTTSYAPAWTIACLVILFFAIIWGISFVMIVIGLGVCV